MKIPIKININSKYSNKTSNNGEILMQGDSSLLKQNYQKSNFKVSIREEKDLQFPWQNNQGNQEKVVEKKSLNNSFIKKSFSVKSGAKEQIKKMAIELERIKEEERRRKEEIELQKERLQRIRLERIKLEKERMQRNLIRRRQKSAFQKNQFIKSRENKVNLWQQFADNELKIQKGERINSLANKINYFASIIPPKKNSEIAWTKRGMIVFKDSNQSQSQSSNLFSYFPEISQSRKEEVKHSKKKLILKEKTEAKEDDLSFLQIIQTAFSPRVKKAFAYSFSLSCILLLFPIILIAYRGIRDKREIENFSLSAVNSLQNAKSFLEAINFEEANKNFDLAKKNFEEAQKKLKEVGGIGSEILSFVPGVSQVETGKKITLIGENIALAGKEFTEIVHLLNQSKEDLKLEKNSVKAHTSISLVDLNLEVKQKLDNVLAFIGEANVLAYEIEINDIPKENRDTFLLLQEALPKIEVGLADFLKYNDLFLEILGQKGMRRYLILFENHHELRATGGFIGTYGVLKINDGRIEDILVDGIYNPDGQLKAKIIPPEPIQKMVPAWSMRDANWWPHFPRSAEKVSWFYEKTGGPSVDGVIALTPKIIQEFLQITGPIKVEGYGEDGEIEVDSSNFMDVIQEEVELNYDKEENKPKKILADLTPLVLNKIFNSSYKDWPKILDIFSQSLKEKHLILYSFNSEVQSLISDLGWSGEILKTKKDYLNIVNTNIGGLKTDGLIEQKIDHKIELQKDGTIIDNVTIERRHKGGNSDFYWHNETNKSWMRVYVPKGSELLSATGFTKESIQPPVDYEKTGFKTDPDVKNLEGNFRLDEISGTKIYEEDDKTVFANWVFTIPGEKSVVSYKYLLPFRIAKEESVASTYSILYQKQAGTENIFLSSQLSGFNQLEYLYKYPENITVSENGWVLENDFLQDKFYALVVKRK